MIRRGRVLAPLSVLSRPQPTWAASGTAGIPPVSPSTPPAHHPQRRGKMPPPGSNAGPSEQPSRHFRRCGFQPRPDGWEAGGKRLSCQSAYAPPAFPSTPRPQGGTANSSLVSRHSSQHRNRFAAMEKREGNGRLVGDRGRPTRGLPEIGKQVKTPMFSVISHPATRLEAASPRAASEIVRPHKEGEKETPIGPIFYRTNRSSPDWKRLHHFASRPSFSLPLPLPSPRHTTFPFSGAGQGTGC